MFVLKRIIISLGASVFIVALSFNCCTVPIDLGRVFPPVISGEVLLHMHDGQDLATLPILSIFVLKCHTHTLLEDARK